MRRILIAIATALCTAAAVVPASAAPTARPALNSDEIAAGVKTMQTCRPTGAGFMSLEIAPEIPPGTPAPIGAGYHRLWDMGVAWEDVNPANGVWNWTVLDQRVAQAQASGAAPMLVLGLTPRWAAADPNAGDPRWGLGTASPPADNGTWRAYVQAVVSRYGTKIGAYEVWNEANLPTFWTGTPVQMAELTQIAYQVIKASNPSAVVTTASTTTRLRKAMARFTSPYIQALQARGNPYDALAIHSYPAGNEGPSARFADVEFWQATVVEASNADAAVLSKPVWDTEVNYGLAGPGPTPATDYTDAQGADLIAKTFADSLTLGIDATFWYLYTAAPFDLLGVQLWSGTPISVNRWNSLRTTYRAGTNLCGGASPASPSGPAGPSGPAAKSLAITGDRQAKRVEVQGTCTGFADGTELVAWLKVKGQSDFSKAKPATCTNEQFAWDRKAIRRVTVYFSSQDGTVVSNRVVVKKY